MNALPFGWVEARLDELADVRLGRQRSPKNHVGPRMRPYLRAGNVTWRGLDLTDVKEMNFSKQESDVYELRPGDVLVAEASGSASEVGRPAIWRGEIDGCCFQNTLVRVRSRGPQPEYLRYFLLGEASSGRLGDAAPGVGIHHIGGARLSAWTVAVPPMNEQRRIVAAIEEPFSRLDVTDQVLRAALRRISRLRRSILIAVIPRPQPSHWKMLRVDDVGKVQLGRQRSPKYHHGPNMKPYLRVANVFEDRLELSDVMQMDFSPDQLDRYRLHPGDILLNEGQSPELVGRPAMFRGELPEVCFTNSLIRFQPGPDIDGEFAVLVFRSHLHSGRFQQEARITTNIAHMAAGRFKTVEFPLPPAEEQLALVTETQRRLSLVDALEKDVRIAIQRTRALRRSILERAFQGELVAQDPADEPALVMLKRIAADRPKAAPQRPRKVTK